MSANAAGWPLVTVRDAEKPPFTVRVKDGDGGEEPLPTPAPTRATVRGSCVALLESDRRPTCAELIVGANVTLSVHCAPPARVAPEAGHVPFVAT